MNFETARPRRRMPPMMSFEAPSASSIFMGRIQVMRYLLLIQTGTQGGVWYFGL